MGVSVSWKQVVLVLCLFGLVVWCNGEEEIDGPAMEEREQLALYSAIQGFVGNWWNGSDLYPDPCGWTPIQGVSCDIFDGLWYVTDLSIGHVHENSLDCAPNAEFRPQLFALRHLKSLSFFSCFMKNSFTVPTSNWEKLAESLEKLEFRSNPSLVGHVPNSFGSLMKLQSLVLLENGLTGELPSNIGQLTSLKRLVLSGNRFTGKIPDSFGYLNQLLILDLSRNSISGILPNSIGGLSSLLKLDLSNNYLQGSIPEEMGNLKNLTILDVRNNNFSGGISNSIQKLSSLEEVALSNNPIGGNLKSTDWNQLQNLTILDLSNTNLTGEIPNSISQLKKLRFLGLNDNNLTGNLPPKLATLPNLSALYINSNNISGELQFPKEFYARMGRRFGAWNNTNLCYPAGSVSTSQGPYGVNPCAQMVKLDEPRSEPEQYSEKLDQSYNLGGALGLGIKWWRWVVMVRVLMMVLNSG